MTRIITSAGTTGTGIDYALPKPQHDPRYGFFARLGDSWAGRRDAGRLTPVQASDPGARAGERPGDAGEEPVPVPAWAHARIRELARRQHRERLAHANVFAALALEKARLLQDAAAEEATAAVLQRAAETTAARGPAGDAPAGPGEITIDAAILAARRAREHRVLIAGHEAAASAAGTRAREARTLIAVLETRQELARQVIADRCTDHAQHTGRRLATYARGMARRRPGARVLRALTDQLILPD